MIVYIVKRAERFEPQTTIAVFSSQLLAKQFIEEYAADVKESVNNFWIDNYELDSKRELD